LRVAEIDGGYVHRYRAQNRRWFAIGDDLALVLDRELRYTSDELRRISER